VNAALASTIVRRGLVFAVIGLASYVEQQGSFLWVASSLGVGHVAGAALVIRSLPLLYSMVAMVTVPLWPALADAAREGDVDWMRAASVRAGAFVMIFAVASGLAVALVGGSVVRLWTGGMVPVSTPILFAAALLIVVDCWVSFHCTVLISLGHAGTAAPVLLAQACLGLVATAVLVGPMGEAAALAGPVVGGLLIAVPIMPIATLARYRSFASAARASAARSALAQAAPPASGRST
jgi:O-antigen/teichoic acid export membrane protein